jgi:hypothetical protein
MCAKAFFFEVNLVFTTGLLAELGFLGVQIRNRKTTPLRCGDFANFGRLHL